MYHIKCDKNSVVWCEYLEIDFFPYNKNMYSYNILKPFSKEFFSHKLAYSVLRDRCCMVLWKMKIWVSLFTNTKLYSYSWKEQWKCPFLSPCRAWRRVQRREEVKTNSVSQMCLCVIKSDFCEDCWWRQNAMYQTE